MDKQISKHISNGNLKIKKKSQIGGNKIKLSPNSHNYKMYLQNGGKNTKENATPNVIINKDNPEKKIHIKRNEPSKNNGSTIKIIRQKEKKSKHKFTRKKPSKIKDINEIEKKMELNKPKSKIEKIPKKEIAKEIVKEIKRKPKIETKPKTSNKRNSKRSNKRNNKKGSRKISLKHKKITEKEVEKVKNHIKEIRSKKTEEIKKDLEKQGIKVSGKSNRLLKDIYLYSKVSGINIQHEK